MVLRRYGLLALDVDGGTGSITRSLVVINPDFDDIAMRGDRCTVVFLGRPEHASQFGLEGWRESPGRLLFEPKRSWFRKPRPIFHPLLDFVSFTGDGLTPLVQTEGGRVAIGWFARDGRKILLVGLDVVEELVRYTQGNPNRVSFTGNRNLWGAGHEQATFLYSGHIVPRYELQPWADKVGNMLVEAIAVEADIPLISPLPGGVQGGIILTGDDDQAMLEKYEEQLAILGDLPITYCMLPHTNHTQETLARLPETVEFGVHVDALERPGEYAELCNRQTAEVRKLLGDRPAHTIRNHGHLNSDYWGHLPAWEAAGLTFGLNIRGMDGTCPTGSYLPFRVRRPDGSWSTHTSLFSTFSDSMFFLQKWSEDQQIKVIEKLAAQIEETQPGILVFNFHPQNVGHVPRVHRAVVALARRAGWKAFGAESFRQWLDAIDKVRMSELGGGLVLSSEGPVHDLAVRWPGTSISRVLSAWQGSLQLMAKC